MFVVGLHLNIVKRPHVSTKEKCIVNSTSGKTMEKINVATVCGNEMRIYGSVTATGVRKLISAQRFRTYGHALEAALAYDEKQQERLKKIGG